MSARDFNETTHDWAGSRFKAAGDRARVWTWEEPGVDGFNFNGHSSAVAGDWFIIDYTATNVGECNVWFYDNFEPVYYFKFTHVRTRDFNKDTKVDFGDFAVFASYWQVTGCKNPDWCEGADLDTDGDVDPNDLMLFVEYWLQMTEYNIRTRDFNRDTEVNFIDFATLASQWEAADCKNPDWCEGADLDTDRNVDLYDLMLFADYWLEGIE